MPKVAEEIAERISEDDVELVEQHLASILAETKDTIINSIDSKVTHQKVVDATRLAQATQAVDTETVRGSEELNTLIQQDRKTTVDEGVEFSQQSKVVESEAA